MGMEATELAMNIIDSDMVSDLAILDNMVATMDITIGSGVKTLD